MSLPEYLAVNHSRIERYIMIGDSMLTVTLRPGYWATGERTANPLGIALDDDESKLHQVLTLEEWRELVQSIQGVESMIKDTTVEVL